MASSAEQAPVQLSYPTYPPQEAHGVKRELPDRHESLPPDSKRMRPAPVQSADKEKSGKGLRHFAMKVCKKVKEKGITTYNEVADELVMEQQISDEERALLDGEEDPSEPHGPKNIRRRVYDALNVLMAMNIISKEKKEIKWIGLPSNSMQEYQHMLELKSKKADRIKMKMSYLKDLILQQIAFKNLLKRNERKQAAGIEHPSSSTIHLPFIIVNTSKAANINCQMAGDKAEYYFDFSQPFEIHDDMEVLKRMGLAFHLEQGSSTPEEVEEAKTLIPSALADYLPQMASGAAHSVSELGGASAIVDSALTE